MPHRSSRLIRRLAFAGALAFALVGCGVKGPLEPPPGETVDGPSVKASLDRPPITGTSNNEPRAIRRATKQLGTPVKPDDSFVLDPLL